MKYRFDETGLKAAEQKESKNSFSNILSPDDLCALPFLDEVCRTGVSSIKIEGRLKSPEYTALVTRIYREALDAISENRFSDFKKRELEDAMRCLRTMFTRSGGGPGYLKGNSGRAHMTAFGPGRSGAVIGTGDRIRRISGITAAGNNNTLEFFEFRLTPFPAGSKSGRASISLSPGDGVTLISSSGLASGGTVNRVTEDGIMTVCGTIDPAFLNKDQVATVFQTADAALNREIQNVLSSGKPNVKLPAKFSFYAEAGHPAVLTAEEVNYGIRAASKTYINVTEALTRPLSKDEIKAQLLKLGDTCFHAAEINIDVRGSIFMTVSAINALRRQVTAELAKKLESGDSDKSELPETTLPASRKYQTIKKDYTGLLQRGAGIVNSRYYYRLSDFMSEDEDVLAGSKIVYLPWETWESRGFERRLDAEKAEKAIKKAKKAGILAVASLPLLPFRADTAQFQKTLKYISETADGIMLANTGDFGVLEKAGIDLSRMLICADISLNSTNPRTVEELSRMGADIIALSPEYPDVAIAGKVPENVMIELVSGPLPLMRMRHCVIGHGAVGCSRCERRDRKFRICDTAGSKYDIITLPDMDNTGSVSGGSENGRRFCENIILSAGVFEPKASMQGDSPLLILSSALIQGRRFYSSTAAQAGLRTLPNNLILRTQVWNGDDNDERNN